MRVSDKNCRKILHFHALTMILAGTTWRSRTAVKAGTSASRALRSSSGILAKASLLGANTVKGPSPARVSTRPAAWRAASRVEKSGLPATISGIDSVGAAVARLHPSRVRKRARDLFMVLEMMLERDSVLKWCLGVGDMSFYSCCMFWIRGRRGCCVR